MHLAHQGKEGCDPNVGEGAGHQLFMARPTPDGIPAQRVRRFILRSDKPMHSSALSLPFLANTWSSTSAKNTNAGSTNWQPLLRCRSPVAHLLVHLLNDQPPQTRRPYSRFPLWSLARCSETELGAGPDRRPG